MAVSAGVLAGVVRVSSGSRMAGGKAALRSPQAILRCVFSSAIKAYDCASLPVPAVAGTPVEGRLGFFALPKPRGGGVPPPCGGGELVPLAQPMGRAPPPRTVRV